MTRRTALWLVVALLGIVACAAVAWTASRLAGQRIGLSSAPLSAVDGLAPDRQPGAARLSEHGRGTLRFSTTGRSAGRAPSVTRTQTPGDDSSGTVGQETAGPDD